MANRRTSARDARPVPGRALQAAPAPAAPELRRLIDEGRYAEAAALLDGVDLSLLDTEAQYLAGVCFGSTGQHELAVDLLKRAAARGLYPFWCAYHLGLFEQCLDHPAHAAYYFVVSLIRNPERTDILPLLAEVAPDNDIGVLRPAQAGSRSKTAAQAAFQLGVRHEAGSAAFYFTVALAFDPDGGQARARLLELAPDIQLDLLPAPPPAEEKRPAPTGGREAPPTGRLRALVDSGRYTEATALLDGIDLERDLEPEFEYLAGVCLGSVGQNDVAIDLLKRAVANGFLPFWCAYHLGLFEMNRGNHANAAHYFSISLLLDPSRSDIYPLLEQVAPGVDLTSLRAAQTARKREHGALPPGSRHPPLARELETLANSGRYGDALALLDGVDLAADLSPDFLYIAAVCLGSSDAAASAIDLLKRAVEARFPRFWCAYHLGIFEEKLGHFIESAYYYTVSLLLEPARTDLRELLVRVVPDADLTLLHEAKAKIHSGDSAQRPFRRGMENLQTGSPGAAASCFAIALAVDPGHEAARSRLLEIAPGVCLDLLSDVDMDRVAAELRVKLTAPPSDEFDIQRKVAWAEAVYKIYSNNDHPSGRTLIPALEQIFHRALAARTLDVDSFCVFFDMFYFLYCWFVPDWGDMRDIAGNVMRPSAAAIRDGALRGIPTIVPRPLGQAPLRIGYLAYCVLPSNSVGRGVGDLLVGLSRYLPGTYELTLYAWLHHDDAFTATLIDHGITVRQFTANRMSERIAAVAEAITADEIDILITDVNSALPTVLFERHIAPVQIFFQTGLPYWPLANVDGVFRVEFYDPKLDGFEPEMCFNLGLGAWNQTGYEYAPPVERARIAAERARLRLPPEVKLAGIYGRLVKIKPYYLEMITQILARHPQLVVLLGGTGQVKWIHDFIAEPRLAERLVLVDEYVDGHVWGHMIDLFLDTSVDVTVAGREIMAKGRPIVCMRTPTLEHERVPMLIADNRAMYVDLASRLIEDPAFYEAACAATREFVAAQPDERAYATAVHDALSTVVERVKRRTAQ